jgi:RNA polymerase sigma factor (sigma-70 family)
MTTEQSVPVLVQRAVAGDEAAWAAIVDRYASLIWSVCRRFGLYQSDADDVAQAVWLRLLEHLPALREPAALPGWLVTTTRRECLRYAQKAQGRTAHEAPLFDEMLSQPAAAELDDGLLQAERFDALRAAFAVLGEKCRKLLGLLLRDPTPAYAEISAELGMPVGSIGPIRARCLENLRRTPELSALAQASETGWR